MPFWTRPPGDMVPAIQLNQKGIPPAREYCSVGGRLKSRSASRRVPLGWWMAVSSWLRCADTWCSVIFSQHETVQTVHTSGSKPYVLFSPPDPKRPAHLTSGFSSAKRETPIALHLSEGDTQAWEHVLSIWELVRPRLDVDSVLAIRCDEPLDLATELLERLLRGLSVRVRNVDKDALVAERDGSRPPSDRNRSEAGLRVRDNSRGGTLTKG